MLNPFLANTTDADFADNAEYLAAAEYAEQSADNDAAFYGENF